MLHKVSYRTFSILYAVRSGTSARTRVEVLRTCAPYLYACSQVRRIQFFFLHVSFCVGYLSRKVFPPFAVATVNEKLDGVLDFPRKLNQLELEFANDDESRLDSICCRIY